MKKMIFFSLSLFCFSALSAQSEITYDGGTKIIKGFMTRTEVDTAFTWFKQNQQGYTPEASALQAFRANKDSISLLVFGGTWCGDTKALLPRFYSLTDAAGVAANRITLIGVDRSKKTLHHLTETFAITHVPTFIVLKNGKEIGRVVEYGTSGMFDKELGDIITKSRKK